MLRQETLAGSYRVHRNLEVRDAVIIRRRHVAGTHVDLHRRQNEARHVERRIARLAHGHEVVFGDDVLVVRRRTFGYLAGEWRLPLDGEVRVGLAYRGVQVSRGPKSVGTRGQLSVVVGSGAAEVAFGTHLDHNERARLAILIDHYFNGVA